MDADQFADDVIQAVQVGAQVFTLPRPTLQDVLVWIESENPGYELPIVRAWIERRMREDGYAEPFKISQHDRYVWMIRFAAKALALGFIDQSTHDRLMSAERIDHNYKQALRERVHLWRPNALGVQRHPNGQDITCYTLRTPDGEYLQLTFEDGRWIRHEGFPYASRNKH